MQASFPIFRQAATGDVRAIFSGGRQIPENYLGLLLQYGEPVGLLEPGLYNPAIILQSLPEYDGSHSDLYEVCSGELELPLTIKRLPDPGNIHGYLTAHLLLHLHIEDVTAVLSLAPRDRHSLSTTELGEMLHEEINMLLDPIVACENRENLFRPSVFHETARLTITDYINTTFATRGILLDEIVKLEFEEEHSDKPQPSPPPVPVGRGRPGAPERPPSPHEQRERPGERRRSTAPPGQFGDWGRNLNVNPELAPSIEEDVTSVGDEGEWERPAKRGPDQPRRGAQRDSFAADVASLRRELARRLLSEDFVHDFSRATSFHQRFNLLRELDSELLFSDERVSELAQKLTPGQFDFRWAHGFLVDQQRIFSQEEMQEFRRLIARSSVESVAGMIDRNRAMLEEDGRVSRAEKPDSGPLPRVESGELPSVLPEDLEEEPQVLKPPDTPDGNRVRLSSDIYQEHPDLYNVAAEKLSKRKRESSGGVKYRPPTLADALKERESPRAHKITRGDRGISYRSESDTGEYGLPEDFSVNVAQIGEIDLLLGNVQSIIAKGTSTWIAVLHNRTSLSFSQLRLTIQAGTLMTAGPVVLTELAPDEHRAIEMQMVMTGSPQSGEATVSAVGYMEGGVLPYALLHEGNLKFRPSNFGNEHLVTIGESAGSRLISKGEMGRHFADLAATGGLHLDANEARMLTLEPSVELTDRLRSRVPSPERGICPVCDNETARPDSRCHSCGLPLPAWFSKAPLVLTPEHNSARARVERAKVWTGEGRDSRLWIALAGTVTIGRRHDNDFVLRAFDRDGGVDERRTTEISRVAGKLTYSQGRVKLLSLNRHGLLFQGALIPMDQEVEIRSNCRIEFVSREGDPVLGVNFTVIGPPEDKPGPLNHAQAILITQDDDPRGRDCLYLIGACSIGVETSGHRHDVHVGVPDEEALGRLIAYDECLWLEPNRELRLRNARSGEMLTVGMEEILRIDEGCRADLEDCELNLKVYHTLQAAQR